MRRPPDAAKRPGNRSFRGVWAKGDRQPDGPAIRSHLTSRALRFALLRGYVPPHASIDISTFACLQSIELVESPRRASVAAGWCLRVPKTKIPHATDPSSLISSFIPSTQPIISPIATRRRTPSCSSASLLPIQPLRRHSPVEAPVAKRGDGQPPLWVHTAVPRVRVPSLLCHQPSYRYCIAVTPSPSTTIAT